MKQKHLFAAGLVLIACLSIGFWIARHKPLWTDEYYSMVSSIYNLSYADHFLGKIPEGNNSPFFYSLQKFIFQMIGYQVPEAWLQGHWADTDAASKITVRILPVTCMSLSIALMFYYFVSRYSIFTGLLGLIVYASSYMLWPYWAEARPYALIVLLTTVQSLLLLKMIENKNKVEESLIGLVSVNILLSLSSILNIGSILASGAVVWLWHSKNWYKQILLTLIPVAISLFYYVHAPKYQFCFDLTPEQLIRDNISRERFYIFFIFITALLLYFFQQKTSFLKLFTDKTLLKPIPYFLFTTLVLLSMVVVLALFKWHATPSGQGFSITSRYFICLTPISVLAATLISTAIIRSLSNHKFLQWALALIIGMLFLQRFFKIVPRAIRSILGV